MAATANLLLFYAPELAPVPTVDIEQALQIAEGYRPACLPEAKGDDAVVFYAAWILSVRSDCDAAPGGGTVGPLLMEKEGDQQRQYGGARDTNLTAADLGNYKARYDALAKLCGYGGIMTRDSVPLRRL